MIALSDKQYLVSIVAFPILTVLLIISIGVKGLFVDNIFGYQSLYSYQLGKITQAENVETVFIGDSSLGNSINAELYTELSGSKAINISLTGIYGYAGSYNMMKKVISQETKNVVLMQTLDILKRDISYEGYLMTLGNLDDVMELSYVERNKLLSSFFKLVTSPGNLYKIMESYFKKKSLGEIIENDYVKQGDPIKIGDHQGFSLKANKDKTYFLRKIIAYCKNNNINLTYTHGPIHETIGRQSSEYINKINGYLTQLNNLDTMPHLTIITDTILIDDSHIGDNRDHVHPNYKNLYTEKYFRLIN